MIYAMQGYRIGVFNAKRAARMRVKGRFSGRPVIFAGFYRQYSVIRAQVCTRRYIGHSYAAFTRIEKPAG